MNSRKPNSSTQRRPDTTVVISARAASPHRPRRYRILEPALLRGVRAALDGLAIALGFGVSYLVRMRSIQAGLLSREPISVVPYGKLALAFTSLTLLVFWRLGLYERRASVLNLWELRTAVKGTLLAASLLFAGLFFFRLTGFSRLIVVGAVALSTTLVIVHRRIVWAVVRRLQTKGRLGNKVLIYGCGDTGRLLMKKIVQAPQLGCSVVGFLDDAAPVGSQVACRIAQTGSICFEAPVLGRWRQWRQIVTEYGVDELLISSSLDSELLREVLEAARPLGLRLGVVPHLEDIRADQFQAEDLSAIPVLRPVYATAQLPYRVLKRTMDVLVASLLLIGLLPLWLMIAVFITLDSRGPILFVQDRVGLRGRRFRILKFRSMAVGTNSYTSSPRGDTDARITRFGRPLRMTGLDELPQLLNVIRGDMSLVGPRPEMPFIVDGYSPLERQRLEVKPGLTGLWQLSADRHAEIHHNLEYDLYYISHQSLTLDVLILAETVLFTVGLIVRLPWRHSRSAGEPIHIATELQKGDATFVLVVLDQRRGSELPSSWRTLVPIALSIADRVPVRILVARDNVSELDRVIAEVSRTARGGRLDYTIYQHRTQVRSLVREASLVLTDLPYVAVWAEEAGTDVAVLRDADIHLTSSTEHGERVTRMLGDLLGSPTLTRETAHALTQSAVHVPAYDHVSAMSRGARRGEADALRD